MEREKMKADLSMKRVGRRLLVILLWVLAVLAFLLALLYQVWPRHEVHLF